MQSLVINPVGSDWIRIQKDPDPSGSKVSGSGLDPDPARSKNSGSGAPLTKVIQADSACSSCTEIGLCRSCPPIPKWSCTDLVLIPVRLSNPQIVKPSDYRSVTLDTAVM